MPDGGLPVVAGQVPALLQELAGAVALGIPVALATVVEAHRSTPRRPGAKMLVGRDGGIAGTIGGGELERRVVEEARAALADGRPRMLHYDLVDRGRGDPGVCGGEVTVYVEPYRPPATVLVVGCGHVGRAVAALAHWVGFRVVVTDDRAELMTAEGVPGADVLVAGPVDDALREVDDRTHVVVVTRDQSVDAAVLPALVASGARSIGVIGSHRRWRTTRDQLLAVGVPARELDRVRSPIGVELQAETPEEIAVSIVAELVALERGGDAVP